MFDSILQYGAEQNQAQATLCFLARLNFVVKL